MLKWRYILFFVLIFCVAACQGESSTPHPALPTQSLPTATPIIETPTQSPTVEVSATFTPSPTVTPSGTPTALPSETSSPTMTEEPASFTLNQDSKCRIGPGTAYDVRTYVSEGINGLILGGDEDQTWWLIPVDSGLDLSCWVSEVVVSVKGNLLTVPVLTPPPLPVDTATPTPQAKGIFYYLLAEDTGGPVGCGDSLVRIYPGINYKPDKGTNVKAALNALFSQHSKYVDGLLNPIYESRMKAKEFSFDPSTGVARIQLRGTFVKPVDVCESKRMHAQVFYTVSQFEKIGFTAIHLNNALLGDLMEK
jgi:hypothetical protein